MNWTSCEKELPWPGDTYLVYNGEKIGLAYVSSNGPYWCCEVMELEWAKQPTHWMTLPKPPKE